MSDNFDKFANIANKYIARFHPDCTVISHTQFREGFVFYFNAIRSLEDRSFMKLGLGSLFIPSDGLIILIPSAFSRDEFNTMWENRKMGLFFSGRSHEDFLILVAKPTRL